MATGRYGQSATARSPVGRARGPADQADWRSALARAGLAAKGALYATLGLLAIQVAAGDTSSQSANPRGAIELVASQPFGQWLLGFLTLGLFALAIWQVLLAFTGNPVEGSKPKARAKFAVKAIVYFCDCFHRAGNSDHPVGSPWRWR